MGPRPPARVQGCVQGGAPHHGRASPPTVIRWCVSEGGVRALSNPIIAIVDDDAEVRGSLLSLMRSAGFDARGFDGAVAFLDSPARDQAACLVTDLHMPVMDGLALQAALRDAGNDLPIIIMTAFADPALSQRALEAGAAAFLCKPLDPEDLLTRVEAAVTGRDP